MNHQSIDLGSTLPEPPGAPRVVAAMLAIACLAPAAGVYLGLPGPRLALWAAMLCLALAWLARGGEIALPRASSWAAAALLAALAVASAFSTNLAGSLDALTMAVACLLLTAAAASASRTSGLRARASDLLLLGGLLTFLGGILLYPAGTGDLHGLFGNKNHLGGYLALLFPLAACLFLDAGRRNRLIAYGAATVLFGAGLILSQSRGAWAAGAAGVMLALAVIPTGDQRWRRLLAVAVLAAALVLVVDRAAPLVSASAGAAAVGDVTALAAGAEPEGTLAPRLDYWQGAWRIFLDHPLTGVGPGAFASALPPYQLDPTYYSRYAHQILLQTSAEAGLPGLVALPVLLAAAAVAVGMSVRSTPTPDRALTAGLAGGLAASLLHNLVDLDWYVPVIAVAASVAAGLALAGAPSVRWSPAARRAAGLVAALALMWTGMRAIETASLDQAARSLQAGDAPATSAWYELAGLVDPLSSAPRLAMARLVLSRDGTPAPVTLAQGIALANQAVQQSTLDVEARSVLAALLQGRDGPGDADEAVRQLQAAAARRQPAQAPAVYAALGRALWGRGRMPEAEAVYRSVADAFPLLPPPAMDAAAVSESHLVLGNLAAGRGDLQAAAREYRLGLAADPANASGHFNLGVIYLQLGDAAAARVYLEQALATGPDLAVARYTLGLALAMSGDTPGARAEWLRALQLDPACDACRQELQRTGGP